MMGNKTFRQVSTTVTTDWTDILEVICEEYASMEVEVINGGAVALSDFQVLFRNHADGNYYVHQGASSVAYEIAAPGTLAGSGKSYLTIDISGVQAVKLQAKTGATSTTISVYGNMSDTNAQIAVATESKQDAQITAQQAIQAAVKGIEFTAATGAALTCTLAATDYTASVTAGSTYIVKALDGTIKIGFADTGTPANIIYQVNAQESISITIPTGVTALHYQSAVALTSGWISKRA